ncbi:MULTISPECIES: orotate phosphoribosyltransferase-like protein [Methanoculleus]|jgi:orotate phosphoribosyltransferase|uniref:Transcriptional regulator GfcR n=1 Tax=Methanoculleus thermophilus TaxID=2200 RepID=A0A1G9BE91_9EURY|nr:MULTISPECIES: orotate phosphoribosyltransferase-like protein [Methanoculleus]NLN08193.1 orotate phosphoribosyltransferase-like protein [Methanoculleus thermophilus]SDK37773.1 orotate phosphoribosyltransferase [Methanoculleus thermophilus]HQD25644.1 orotate phosphoribosyltransferase-like protein [Methanoculleus thermophilus]
MTALEELITKAKALQVEGQTPGQISDQLGLSMETVTWLLTQQKGMEAPKDVHIDWTAVGSHGALLSDMAMMMLKRFLYMSEEGCAASEIDAVVGIASSGVPLATLIAAEEGLKLAVYLPAKHSGSETPTGSLSGTFSTITGQRCIIIDDVVTTGTTLSEAIQFIRRHGATPVAVWSLFDKRGVREVDGVPVHSLFVVSRLG